MLYCPPNSSITDVWVDNGIPDCFMSTVSSSLLAAYLLVFGSAQLWMYSRYGNRVSRQTSPPALYVLQLLFTVILTILPIFSLALNALNDKGAIYGYEILSLVFQFFVFPFSAVLIIVERNYLLPSVPTRGHGLVLLLFWTLMFISINLLFINIHREDWWTHLEKWSDQAKMGLFVTKYTAALAVFCLGIKAPGISLRRDFIGFENYVDPLSENEVNPPSNSQGSTWRNAWKKIKTLSPFLWPRKSFSLKLRVGFCFILLIAGRAINVYVPIYSKYIVDSLAGPKSTFRWDLVLIYVGFKFLQGGGTGGMGVLNNLRSFLWIRVQQYTTREVEVELFHHLHNLSLRWHLSRKTGEVLRVMDRGTDSINNLLSYILFSIAPTIVDILIAIIYLISAFNVWFGLIVFLTMGFYILETICVTEWRTKFQREMNLADNATKARSVDSLLNFETVKYYGAEDYEVDAFRKAINNYQGHEWKALVSLNILNTLQNITICLGLLSGSLLCVHMVVTNEGLTPGDYVLFANYILQLYVPLNWFGTYYRAIQKNFVDMENMFDLLSENAEVKDYPNASHLNITHGSVEFKNVNFSYVPEQVVLKNVSFLVPGGKTLAIVGPSGSGKSTIMRLLFRFYDINDGEITIDGNNIKFVKQKSLRNAIGVVPQDTVLFNNTIKYNIQYGRIDANMADIINAAKSADMHEKILTFPEQYSTQVGERGLKLSGGEKQRVAIARTLLKSPSIVLLDEATSALDTQTERNIQAALSTVCNNRTTIIIAHRLSTIIHADNIIVLKNGVIVESGRHEELIEKNGEYANMWQQQLKNESSGNELE